MPFFQENGAPWQPVRQLQPVHMEASTECWSEEVAHLQQGQDPTDRPGLQPAEMRCTEVVAESGSESQKINGRKIHQELDQTCITSAHEDPKPCSNIHQERTPLFACTYTLPNYSPLAVLGYRISVEVHHRSGAVLSRQNYVQSL